MTKLGQSIFGAYTFPIVMCLPRMKPEISTACSRMNGVFLLIRIAVPLVFDVKEEK